ncbi:two-component system activity regulator YycH [uncultured Enterococcus sp.]|uniref:YycH family regulatory protein n=1 Tax=uncultured Enterococcus sp. TaxID=167972 RepID=UPI002AA710B9|nr:two-component system activity regulator YycH [uncultured Enterococcus sp.]
MTFLEKLIRPGLIAMILLSLYFSWSIWVSPSNKETTNQGETKVTTTIKERTSQETFAPIRLIRMEETGMSLTASESLISSVQKLISESEFGSLSVVVNGDAEAFDRYYTERSGFELMYEGRFLLSEYLKTYNIELGSTDVPVDQAYFNRLQVDYSEKKLFFFDFADKIVYETSVSLERSAVEPLLKKEGLTYFDVAERSELSNKSYYMVTGLKLKKYSYILASQPITLFRNAFFSDTENIQTNEDSADISYTKGSEKLTVNELGTVHFSGILKNNSEEQNIYSDSFSYVKKMGANIGNLRYFDSSDGTVNYRTFVEGFPVFSESNRGQVKVSVTGRNSEQPKIVIDASVDTIQVPIPSEEEVVLKDSTDLLATLAAYGADDTEIKSIIIGYTWQRLEETKQVVDLTPEWYIYYRDQWYPERELLEKLANWEVQ